MVFGIKKRDAGALLCALALLSTLLAPRGVVLCVGENGHVAIEAAVETAPCGVPLRESNDLGAWPVEDCNDTPILQAALRVNKDSEALVVPLVAIAGWEATARPALRAPRFQAAHRIPTLDLRAQRTIVLLV